MRPAPQTYSDEALITYCASQIRRRDGYQQAIADRAKQNDRDKKMVASLTDDIEQMQTAIKGGQPWTANKPT